MTDQTQIANQEELKTPPQESEAESGVELSDEPIEIELDIEENEEESQPPAKSDGKAGAVDVSGATDGDDVEEKKEKKKRKGNSYNERIAKMSEDRRRAEEYAQEQERQRIETERELAKEREQRRFLQEAAVSSYEKEAQTALEKAKRDYKEAYAAGDAEAMANAQADIAKAAAYQQQVAGYRAELNRSSKPETEKSTDQPQKQQQSQQSAPENPVAKAWLARNPWVDQHSDDFDMEKATDALTYAANLAEQWKAEGKAAQIGTKAYFKAVDDYVAAEWDAGDDEGDEVPEPKKLMDKKAATPVAPQARNGGAGPRPSAKPVVKLTPDEKKIALSLQLKNADGTMKSEMDHYKAYAVSKYQDRQRFADRDAEQAKRR